MTNTNAGRTSLIILAAVVLLGFPSLASGACTEEVPKASGGGLRAFMEQLLVRSKEILSGSPCNTTAPTQTTSQPSVPTSSPSPTPTPTPTPSPNPGSTPSPDPGPAPSPDPGSTPSPDPGSTPTTPAPAPSPTPGQSLSSLTFTAVAGESNPSPQTITITNTGGGTLDWTASETASWLTLSPTSGSTTTETDTLVVSVNTTGLLEGNYSGPITLASPGSTSPSQQIPVTLTVTAPPSTIGLSAISLSWTAIEGSSNLNAQTFNITNTGAGTLNWSASETASWLSLSTTAGATTTGTDVVSVSVNTAGLTANVYTIPITITAAGATNSPQQVLATLAITAPASGTATLTWNANSEADLAGYKVYMGNTSRSYSSPINVGKVTTFKVMNLQPGKTYYFAVTAYNTSAKESGYSNEVNKVLP
jgi:Fibronectin type III domain/Viral BACON domain